jgi:uncharacterized protein (DUF3084 family)
MKILFLLAALLVNNAAFAQETMDIPAQREAIQEQHREKREKVEAAREEKKKAHEERKQLREIRRDKIKEKIEHRKKEKPAAQ